MSRAILVHFFTLTTPHTSTTARSVIIPAAHSITFEDPFKGAMKLLKQKREDSMKRPQTSNRRSTTTMAMLSPPIHDTTSTSSAPAIRAVVAAPINTKRFRPAATKNGLRNLCAHRWLKQL
ncbi:uncharacterized protein F5147DRAFT_232305 [Suillus discolor]|uniref:Uncharacterized protein n=1 Tax=Suillus discolor TaxID=1912936 RepID=A0A9P7F574_9AGAM|nr:uncharacterized protein F5147DRAFT_232305 [Suillus discolor]KAG2106155.1 hypothetical protein F5147DRAFT_232305 [Suillus discolor]